MVFYKPTPRADGVTTFQFQIMSEVFRDDFSIWDNTKKTFIKGQGVTMQGTNNQTYTLDQMKFIPANTFQMLFPNFQKNTQYVWGILINGSTSYDFGFKKTAHDELMTCIQNAKAFGLSPLEVSYVYRRTGSGLSTEHHIIAGERVGIPQNVRMAEAERQQPYTMPIAQVIPTPPLPQASSVTPRQPISGTFPTQGGQSYPARPKVSGFGSVAPKKAIGQDYLELDADEQAILDDSEKSSEKLKEIDFINGFASALSQRGKNPDVMRIIQIYRQLYV